MSLQFNDTTSARKGIIQLIEKRCGLNYGDISGNSDLMSDFTAEVNLAIDDAMHLIFQATGKWQYDDSNNTDYPILTHDLVQGQRDYPFVKDASGNLILDIYKVLVANTGGIFYEIYPIDQQLDKAARPFWDNINTSSLPTRYDKTGNALFLDPIPNFNYAGGLKMFVNREMLYFTIADTTKMPGFAGPYHKYLALKASYGFASTKLLSNAKAIWNDILICEDSMRAYYGNRSRDEAPIMSERIPPFK